MKVTRFVLAGIGLLLTISCRLPGHRRGASAEVLENTKWMLVSLGDGAQAGTGYQSWLSFGQHNAISALAICNNISGSYFTDPGKKTLHLSDLVITYKACKNYPAEAAILNTLKAADHYEIRGKQLILWQQDRKLAVYRFSTQ